jgi:acetylornithine/N-succinyldiaminopimelate aminotransferase
VSGTAPAPHPFPADGAVSSGAPTRRHEAGADAGSLHARWAAVMQDNYGTPPIALVSGAGCWVRDDAGRQYLDLVAGIAVNALGHAHPVLVAAVTDQVTTLGHTSNLAITEPAIRLSERLALLADPSGHARVFLCNSGAEANEAAFKLARLTGRPRMVATVGGFHGRTMGALALTGQPAKADPFRPLPGEVTFVPYGDVEALAAAVAEDVAAVILEPIQGESGVVVPPPGYLAAARRITADVDALLVLDEVQTGIGRTGRWFAHHARTEQGIRADVVTVAKGLAGGLPIGAMIRMDHERVPAFQPGAHGSTFGGNPISAAAALAVLDTIAGEDLLQNARDRGEQLRRGLSRVPGVATVRGAGLLLGVVLEQPIAKGAEQAARDAGVLVNAPAPDVIRLAPPLIIGAAEAEHAIAVLARVIAEVGATPPGRDDEESDAQVAAEAGAADAVPGGADWSAP